MFDRVTDFSRSLAGESGSVEDADSGPIGELLDDGEAVAHVLANGGTIEYTKDDRSTKIEPNGDNNAYVLVTDTRILYVLGDQPDEVEIEIEMTDLTASHVRSGLLSSKLLVKTENESVVFTPDDGDVEAAEDFIDRVSDCWIDMEAAFVKARSEMASFEQRCAEGGDPREIGLSAKSHLSKARHAATHDSDAPTEKLQERITEVRAELDRRRIVAWLDRVETDVETAATAEENAWDEQRLAALVDASNAAERATVTIEDVDTQPADAADRLAELSDRIESLSSAFLEEMDTEIAAARDADRQTAVEHWSAATEGYRTAVAAGWDGIAGVSADALEYQIAWLEAKRIHELTAWAEHLEGEGDATEDNDAACEYFERAQSSLERAVSVAEDAGLNGTVGLQTDLDRLEEKKLERAGWEFGNA